MARSDPELTSLLAEATAPVRKLCHRAIDRNVVERNALLQAIGEWTREGRPLDNVSLFGVWLIHQGLIPGSRFEDLLEGEDSSDDAEGAESVTLGPFTLIEELGRGAMGVVYAGKREGSDELFAVKVVNLAGATEKKAARFEREIRILVGLNHPNIVRVDDCGTVADHAYYAMELVRGLPFDEWRKTAPVEACLRVVRDVARGLYHAHERGIVHRDIKPHNILVLRDGTGKLTDFGLARATGEKALTRTGQVLGTPYYMAPEMVIGQAKRVGPESDQYSLGVVLFEVLTDRLPFLARTPDELFQKICREPHPLASEFASDLPEPLVGICDKMMQKVPEDRFSDCGAVAETLTAHLEGRTVELDRVSSWSRLWRTIRSRPLVAGGGVLGLLLLAGVLFLFTEHGPVRIDWEARWRSVEERTAHDRVRALTEGEDLLESMPEEDRVADLRRRIRRKLARLAVDAGRPLKGAQLLQPLLRGKRVDPDLVREGVRLLWAGGRYEDALKQAERLSDAERLDLLWQAGQVAALESAATRVLEQHPDRRARVLRFRARLLLGQQDRAEEDLAVLEKEGAVPRLRIHLLLSRGEGEEAFERGLEAGVFSGEPILAARLLLAIGRPKEAVRRLRPLVEEKGGTAPLSHRLLLAEALLQAGDGSDALSALAPPIPSGHGLLRMRARTLVALGRFDEAEEALQALGDDGLVSVLGVAVAMGQKEREEAEERARRLLAAGENAAEARAFLTFLHLDEADPVGALGRSETARAIFETAEDPESEPHLVLLDDDPTRVAARFRARHGLRMRNDSASALWRAGRRAVRLADSRRGLRLFQQAHRLDPVWAEPLLGWARLVQDPETRRDLLTRALLRDPTHPAVVRAWLSDLDSLPGNRLLRLLETRPELRRARCMLARQAIESEDVATARRELEKVLDAFPYHEEALQLRLELARKKGDEESIASVEAALRLAGDPAARAEEARRLAGEVQAAGRGGKNRVERLQWAVELSPTLTGLWVLLTVVQVEEGNLVGALLAACEAATLDVAELPRLAEVLRMAGGPKRRAQLLDRLVTFGGADQKFYRPHALRALATLLARARNQAPPTGTFIRDATLVGSFGPDSDFLLLLDETARRLGGLSASSEAERFEVKPGPQKRQIQVVRALVRRVQGEPEAARKLWEELQKEAPPDALAPWESFFER